MLNLLFRFKCLRRFVHRSDSTKHLRPFEWPVCTATQNTLPWSTAAILLTCRRGRRFLPRIPMAHSLAYSPNIVRYTDSRAPSARRVRDDDQTDVGRSTVDLAKVVMLLRLLSCAKTSERRIPNIQGHACSLSGATSPPSARRDSVEHGLGQCLGCNSTPAPVRGKHGY